MPKEPVLVAQWSRCTTSTLMDDLVAPLWCLRSTIKVSWQHYRNDWEHFLLLRATDFYLKWRKPRRLRTTRRQQERTVPLSSERRLCSSSSGSAGGRSSRPRSRSSEDKRWNIFPRMLRPLRWWKTRSGCSERQELCWQIFHLKKDSGVDFF